MRKESFSREIFGLAHISLSMIAILSSSCVTPVGSESDNRALVVAETPTRARCADGSYISWNEHLIDDENLSGGVPLRGADGCAVADLDADGHLDIVSVHEDSDHIRIAFGSPDPDAWALVTLARADEARAAEDVAVADADGDGWLDIVVACELGHLIYFQNPGEDVRRRRWERVIPSVTRDQGSYIRVFFADLDGDGRPEVTAANKGEQLPGATGYERKDYPLNEISWFELPGDPLDASGWNEHVLARVAIPVNAEPVDLDGDGDLDILGGSRHEARIFWFENVGNEGIAFREHAIEVTGRNVPWERGAKRLTGMNVAFHDFNHDGRLDMVLQEDPTLVVWLEQPRAPSRPWKIHLIGTTEPDSSTGLVVVDINDDGRADVFTGGYSEDPRARDGEEVGVMSRVGRLCWFEQPEDPTGEWFRHDVARRKRGMYDVFRAADMDGDGDVDLITTRGNSGRFDGVLWLEQVRSAAPRRAFQPARQSESAHLPLPE